MALVACRTIADDDYISANLSYYCYDNNYFTFAFSMILPSLILWIAIIPLIFFVKLKGASKS